MPDTVVLIACCGKKAKAPCAARDLYQSPLFKKSVAYAERRGLPWAVLSAAHGLVLPDAVIRPYDVKLSDASRGEHEVWAEMAREQIEAAFPGARFIVLAGRDYRAAVPAGRFEVPMARMGIGEQLAFLTADQHLTP